MSFVLLWFWWKPQLSTCQLIPHSRRTYPDTEHDGKGKGHLRWEPHECPITKQSGRSGRRRWVSQGTYWRRCTAPVTSCSQHRSLANSLVSPWKCPEGEGSHWNIWDTWSNPTADSAGTNQGRSFLYYSHLCTSKMWKDGNFKLKYQPEISIIIKDQIL